MSSKGLYENKTDLNFVRNQNRIVKTNEVVYDELKLIFKNTIRSELGV